MTLVFGSPEANQILSKIKAADRIAAEVKDWDNVADNEAEDGPQGELNHMERLDAEEIAGLIIDSGATEVTEEQVAEWGDYDLIEWLCLWDNEWAIRVRDARFS